MSEATKTFWNIGIIFFFIIFLPLALIWYVWMRTDWKKINKWIATAIIVVVFLIIFAAPGSDTGQQNEKQAEIENLKNQLAEEKQKNAQLESPVSEEVPVAQEASEEAFTVEHVVDGDTIKLSNGQIVRYIGINAPKVAASESATECFGKESSDKNSELVEGKDVTLVKDVSETDKYGRILRYVYIGDTFVNDYMVRNGLAKVDNFPPDEKYRDQLKEAQEDAKTNKRGLWADNACKTETSESIPVISPKPVIATPAPKPVSTGSSYACNCSKTCPQMSSCAEAQYQLNTCGCSARDADHDGVACDADCQ